MSAGLAAADDARRSLLSDCLCIVGPTASGKTASALALAEALSKPASVDRSKPLHDEKAASRPVEIISVDSALVYRGMDIGTAKPSAVERAQVPHHLIDIVEPTEHYSAARFVVDASRLIGEIKARGALPLLVGGTMLYFKALIDGLDTMPVADADTRARLSARADLEGWPALHAELAVVDPVTAARLAPRDGQRIQRALEVFQQSGTPMSTWQTRPPASASASSAPVLRPAMISLEPTNRAWLHARIGVRFDAMLANGLVDEVRALRARGDLHADLPAMRCVGYRQTWLAIESGLFDELPAQGSAATRQLAKRQLTWLRATPARHVIACDADDAVEQAVALALRLLGAATPALGTGLAAPRADAPRQRL